MSVVLNIANLIQILTCLTTLLCLSFFFLAMGSTSLLTNRLHSLDMPPDVRNTLYSGGKFFFHIQHSPSTHVKKVLIKVLGLRHTSDLLNLKIHLIFILYK